MHRFATVPIFGALILTSACHSGNGIRVHSSLSGPYYVKRQDFRVLIPEESLLNSDVEKEDLVKLHAWQDNRTKENCTRAQLESHASFESFFGDISPFSFPLPPEVEVFFEQVKSDTDIIGGPIKQKYQRPRPSMQDPTIIPCSGKIKGYSYPSGHASTARVFARILAELMPARATEFMKRADSIGMNRVISGAHYPSDVEAGKQLGDSIYAELQRNPVFKSDIEKMRKYLNR